MEFGQYLWFLCSTIQFLILVSLASFWIWFNQNIYFVENGIVEPIWQICYLFILKPLISKIFYCQWSNTLVLFGLMYYQIPISNVFFCLSNQLKELQSTISSALCSYLSRDIGPDHFNTCSWVSPFTTENPTDCCSKYQNLDVLY